MLSTKQVAVLFNKHESTVRRWAESGKLQAESILNKFNSPEYLFPVDCLPPDIQEKYFYQWKASLPTSPDDLVPERRACKPLDHYTAEEREEIAWWQRTLKDWQRYRNKYPGSKAEADDKFIALCAKTDPEHPLSVDMLYRRQRALDENDLDGLVNKRGKNRKGTSKIPDVAWETFKYFYLDQAQHPVSKCYEYMMMCMREDHPELVADIPHHCTFRRRIERDTGGKMRVTTTGAPPWTG